MKDLLKKVLTNKAARNATVLTAAAVSVAAMPWPQA